MEDPKAIHPFGAAQILLHLNKARESLIEQVLGYSDAKLREDMKWLTRYTRLYFSTEEETVKQEAKNEVLAILDRVKKVYPLSR